MITGNNLLTAISVARDCGIVSSDQAVVSVNARQVFEKERHVYELYYTLEIGNCGDTTKELVNSSDIISLQSSANTSADENCEAAGNYQIFNGDVTSLSSISLTLPNSNSLASVGNCETWTALLCVVMVQTTVVL